MTIYRSRRRRVWIWDIGEWVMTDDHRFWRVAYLAGGAE